MNQQARDEAGTADPQFLASRPEFSVWVSANAGSGKTFILVQRILRLLLAGISPSVIACLTFTRAAAAEMSNRIFAKLGEWAIASPEALADEIAQLEGGNIPDEVCLLRARSLFSEVLESQCGLRIRTIHSFCEFLLRQFALEAHVPPHFDIIDDAVSQSFVRQAQNQLLLDPEMASVLDELVALVAESEFAEMMAPLIGERHVILGWVAFHGGLEAALQDLKFSLGLCKGEVPCLPWEEGGSFPPARVRQLVNALNESGKPAEKKQADRLKAALSAYSPGDRARHFRLFFCTKDGKAARKNILPKNFCKDHPDYAGLVDLAALEFLRYRQWETASHIFRLSAAALRFGLALIERYSALKQVFGYLDNADLIHCTLDLLSKQEATAWVLYKLDGGLDHILIDEAQDMSLEQWKIVEALSEEMFSGEGSRGRTGSCSVFAVGDEKQSIYSFQGACPESFREMENIFHEKICAAQRPWEKVSLLRSFRSVPQILTFVDALFQGHGQEGSTIRHEASRISDTGLVELWPFFSAPRQQKTQTGEEDSSSIREEGEENDTSSSADGEEENSLNVRLAAQIGEKISLLISGQEFLQEKDRLRPITAGDILILVSRRNALFHAIIADLHHRNIPIAGADRIVITNHIAVQDIMAVADVALLPSDDLALAAVLKGPLIGLDEGALFALAHGRSGSLMDALALQGTAQCIYGKAYERIKRWCDLGMRLRPYEFFAHLLGKEGGQQILVSRLGSEAADALEAFLDACLAFEEREIPCLRNFMRWVRTYCGDIKRDLEKGKQEVRVMTVHGAKGLEAEIVILADSCSPPNKVKKSPLLPLSLGDKPAGWVIRTGFSKESDSLPDIVLRAQEHTEELAYAEYYRLLYVAVTRARDRLYVAGALNKGVKEPPKESWYAKVREGFARLEIPCDAKTGVWRYGEAPVPGESWSGEEWERTPHISATADVRSAESKETEEMPAWMKDAVPGGDKGTLPFTSADISFPIAKESPEQEEAIARGLALHRLLEDLPDMQEKDREAAAIRMMAYLMPDLPADARLSLVKEALSIVNDPRFSLFFGQDGLAEVEISALLQKKEHGSDPLDGEVQEKESESLFLGRVDRIVVREKEVLVVDYKTDRNPPQREEDIPRKYIQQLRSYHTVLSGVFAEHKVRLFLIWTANATMMEVSPAESDA